MLKPDPLRTLSFADACRFDQALRAAYPELGYTLIELPCLPVDARADVLLHTLGLE